MTFMILALLTPRFQGCAGYGVDWARPVGKAVGDSVVSIVPQSSARRIVTADSDVYVGGMLAGFLGEAFGIEVRT